MNGSGYQCGPSEWQSGRGREMHSIVADDWIKQYDRTFAGIVWSQPTQSSSNGQSLVKAFFRK